MSYPVAYILNKWKERVTQVPQSIDTDHAYIHEGSAFDVWETVDISGTRWYQFKTSGTKYVHFRPASLSVEGGSLKFSVYLTATGSTSLVSGGSSFAPVNRKHTSGNESGVRFYTGIDTSSTTADNFTLKYEVKAHAGTGPGKTTIGASKGEPLEWIFAQDRDYAIAVTTTDSQNVSMNLFWYEEDNA